jgi:hypothetical protein
MAAHMHHTVAVLIDRIGRVRQSIEGVCVS